ncbi:FAD-linked oxidoreductase family [Clostridium botulinum H04402 065]|uniref:FAD-binding oxidoreductase n=1 Tax=Clostridium botulinum TaxID=1491 RepID=UPI0001F851DD|nr:FAD-dependent oxidoreductase [Clostridium botulinum]OPD31748.1 hypothetical protein AL711_10950 [Clostridium botulinum]CBZ02083.1 FAD-linked oxidoreductase family [Clostridium botulinum H04402 065]
MIEVITPTSNYYDDARQVWNRAIDKYPAAIAYCKTYEDVKKAILFARKNNFKIRVRCGGHNYEGFSIADDALIIDISNLNKIQINYECNTVTVESGAFLGQVYNFLGASEYPFPGGSCPTVGISGVVLGGGWGYSSRYFGLTCDSLLELKMIDYRGCLLTANKNINSDLYWACKGGGGGNFGIVVSMTFKLPPYETLKNLINIINEERPNGSTTTELNVYGFGGQVSKINKKDTAFYYRNSNYIILLETDFRNNLYKQDNINWINENSEYIYNITSGSYINFSYYPLPNYLYDYYGGNVQRLKCIKFKI